LQPDFTLDSTEDLDLTKLTASLPEHKGTIEGYWEPVGTELSAYSILDLLGVDFHITAREHGWLNDEIQRDPLVLLALITSEVGEMVDAFRKPGPSEHIPEFSNAEEEAADIFIRLAQMCAEHKLRLGAAVEAKSIYNKSRPFRHGGKLY
jgi:NTP pyrophosphatase (non-canonical NTP hydrolase)